VATTFRLFGSIRETVFEPLFETHTAPFETATDRGLSPTRTLVVLGQDLVPYRRRAVEGTEEPAPADDQPKLRLNDASQGRGQQRTIKRA
jgi:hypothetical protein